MNALTADAVNTYEEARAAVCRVIAERRDMRHFRRTRSIRRCCVAAVGGHHAPSVGYMQPRRFVRVTDAALRDITHWSRKSASPPRVRSAAEEPSCGSRSRHPRMRRAAGGRACGGTNARVRPPHYAGRTSPPAPARYRTCGGGAKGLGMGWVSIFDPTGWRHWSACRTARGRRGAVHRRRGLLPGADAGTGRYGLGCRKSADQREPLAEGGA